MRRLSPQRLLNISLIAIFILLVLPLYIATGVNDSLDHARGTGTVGGIDFKAYYIAADMLRRGEDFYDQELQTKEVLARGLPLNESFYIYPPLLAVCFVALTALPMHTAAQLWFFINMLLYGVSLWLIAQGLGLHRLTRMLPLLLVLAFLFPPALFTLHKGQVNMVILLLLAATYWLHRKGVQSVAGIALGLATMIKVVPICLLPYFLWKKKYVLGLATVGTIVAISILGLLIVGLGPHQTYLTSVLPTLAEPRPNPANQSLGGFFSLLLIENVYSYNIAHQPALWKCLTLVSSLLFVLGAVFLCWRTKRTVLGEDMEFALVVTTLPLIANIAWVDFFVIVVISYAVLFKYLSQRGTRSYSLLVPVVASVLLVSFPRFLDVFANLVGRYQWFLQNRFAQGLPLYGLTMLWVTMAVSLWQASKKETGDGSRP